MPIDDCAARPSEAPWPEEAVIQGQNTQALWAALQTLEPRQREIVALKFGGVLNNRQIAGLLGLTAGNVGVILYRALQKIREHLIASEGQVRHA